MNKSFFLKLFSLPVFLLPLCHLQAEDDDAYEDGLIKIDGTGNTFITPDHWTRVPSSIPSSYKFMHESGKQEGYIRVTPCDCDRELNRTDLTNEMYSVGIALFGEEFWNKPNFQQGFLVNDIDDLGTWGFLWHTTDEIESVFIVVGPEHEEQYFLNKTTIINKKLVTFCIINKQNKKDFNLNNTVKDMLKDVRLFAESMDRD